MTTTTCIAPHSESFLRSDLWDGVRQKPYKLESSGEFSVLTALLLHAGAENRGLKIHAATFLQGTPNASNSVYPCEVISSWISPCPPRRQGNRGPETGGGLSRAPHPPTGEQQARAKSPLPPICLAHALSISLIRTIDLFILSG